MHISASQIIYLCLALTALMALFLFFLKNTNPIFFLHSYLIKMHLIRYLATYLIKPISAFVITTIIYILVMAFIFLTQTLPEYSNLLNFSLIIFFLKLIYFIIAFWFLWKINDAIGDYLLNKKNFKLLKILLPVISNCFRIILTLILINILLPQLGLDIKSQEFFEKLIEIVLIIIFSTLFFHVANAIEQVILYQYQSSSIEDLSLRKIKTQISILKKVIFALGLLISGSMILLVFEQVRRLGAGLLTTAGLISAIVAFASQQSLSRLLAGLQIAFSQPIRIGDTVIIDSEFGIVEEISLTYIIVRIWDLRRLILPTDYFITHGFQNLSRTSTELIGTVFIYADYTLPVNLIRDKFFNLLESSSNWDKKVRALQVTAAKENVIELRAIMSSSNADKLFQLRCEIRENLITFIVQHFPFCLPKVRTTLIDVFNKESL